jgi:hypothetical protein
MIKSSFSVIILFLLAQYCLGQTRERNLLHGQVINDSIAVENGYVFNLNSNKSALISLNGFFDILAMPKDTLLVNSLALKSQKMVLVENDFKQKLYVVKTELFVNQLSEVIINKRNSLIIPNSQKYVDMKFFDDAQSSPLNRTMSYNGIENGTDFVRMGKSIVGLFKKKDGEKQAVFPDEIFINTIKKDFKPEFFKNTLNLKPEEVQLFLVYCDSDNRAKDVLLSNDRFQIMDFLITKNFEFKKFLQTSNLPK